MVPRMRVRVHHCARVRVTVHACARVRVGRVGWAEQMRRRARTCVAVCFLPKTLRLRGMRGLRLTMVRRLLIEASFRRASSTQERPRTTAHHPSSAAQQGSARSLKVLIAFLCPLRGLFTTSYGP